MTSFNRPEFNSELDIEQVQVGYKVGLELRSDDERFYGTVVKTYPGALLVDVGWGEEIFVGSEEVGGQLVRLVMLG